MQRIAADLAVVIIVPIFERRGPGLYHNSAAVVDADGSLLGVYRKMHIPDDPLYHEKYYFAPGEAGEDRDARRTPDEIYHHGESPRHQPGFRVFDTRYARIGVLICWDQWYPEAARITALMGAQILLYPTAIGWHPREKAEWGKAQAEAWRTIQRGHAIANGVYVAAANRVGHEPEPGTEGIEFFGHSFVCDPFGRLIAEADTQPTVLIARCDPQLIEYTRRNWPFLRDRRIDAYGPILSRYLG
jgi:N-carbamoylputrescine amidase